MAGHAHDSTGAVAHQHIISDPDRNLLAIDGIGDVAACKDARLLLLRAHALDLGHMQRLFHVSVDFGLVFRCGDLLDQWVLWGQHKERDPVDRVRARSEDGNLFTLPIDLRVEANLRPFAAPNPIALHGYSLFRPLDL